MAKTMKEANHSSSEIEGRDEKSKNIYKIENFQHFFKIIKQFWLIWRLKEHDKSDFGIISNEYFTIFNFILLAFFQNLNNLF